MTTNAKTDAQISFRKLWASDGAALQAHLLRLDPESRRMRFGTPVTDYFIAQYAQNALGSHSITHGYFVDGVLRGVAELRGFRGVAGGEAEAAFSVEQTHQNRGIGTELFGRTVLAARMQAIARKFDAVMTYDSDGGHAQIEAPRANPLSIWKEALTDGQDLADTVMQTHSRALRSA